MKSLKKCIWLLLAGAILLGGCSFRTVDEMYCLPKRSEAYKDLQSAIDAAMSGMEYCAPLAGQQRQTVQMADLDGDGQEEYLVFAKGASEMPLRVLIFYKDGEDFLLKHTIENSGMAFDTVEYIQMDNRPGMELVVGCQISDQVIRTLAVYTFDGAEAQQMVTAKYSKFLTVNLDLDNDYDLMVLRPGQIENGKDIAELYSIENGNVERSVEANMSETVDHIKRILVGKLHDGNPAVYIASSVGDEALITDVYALLDGVFTNVSFSNDSGTSVKTMRNYYVYAGDMDQDNVVELPSLITMKALADSNLNTDQYLIRWYAMTSEGGEVDKLYTYHNFVGGWYLKIDSSLASRITVVQQGNQYAFYLWDEAMEQTQKLMTISALTGENRQEQSQADGMFVLNTTESVIYAASLETVAEQYRITQQKLQKDFQLIRQEWNTGET